MRAADVGAERPQRDRTPDAEAALPNLEGVHRVPALAEVRLRGGDEVIEPAAEDAERDGPEADVADDLGLAAALHPPLGGEPQCEEDARKDPQRVRAHRRAARGERPPTRSGGWGRTGEITLHPLLRARAPRSWRAARRAPRLHRRVRPGTAPARSPRSRRRQSGRRRRPGLRSRRPSPTHTRGAPAARVAATSSSAPAPTEARSPVTPMSDAAYTKPVVSCDRHVQALAWSSSVRPRRSCRGVATCAAVKPPTGRVGRQIGRDRARTSRRRKVVGEALEPVLKHRVVVAT